MEGPCTKCVFPLAEDDSVYITEGLKKENHPFVSTEDFSPSPWTERPTPLISAIHNDHQQCVNAWIEAGADVNSEDVDGETALFIAIRKKQIATVKKLIEVGADVNIDNNDGITPLRVAVLGGLDTCLDALIRAGADVC